MKVRRNLAGLFISTVAVAVLLGPTLASPAQAQSGCVTVDYQATHWSDGPDSGGFQATIVIGNDCLSPVLGWTLALALPDGHTLHQGWSAQWSISGAQVTATPVGWNTVIQPGQSITIGFLGRWTGAYQDPVSCTINGESCGGEDPGGNQPPEVELTAPASGTVGVVAPCPLTLTADAIDPDGAIDRVEFYVNGVLVGTDHTAPYQVSTSAGATPVPERVAFARAYDDGTPPLSTDSEPVTFQTVIGDPAPERILPCCGSLELLAGTSEEVRFVLVSSVVDQATLTVTGDPGVTVSPTTVVADRNLILATVTAAAGSAGATATITATAGDLSPATMSVTVR